jgi:CubicO group peptidase (beta-lactamase class C family)
MHLWRAEVRCRLTNPAIERALGEAVRLGELGVQVAVYVGEELVVDTWTNGNDPRTGRPYDDRTLFPAFSVTKAITATCLHIQAERGFVDYAAPVARYWPEFARNGKEAITVRHILTHQSGVPQMPEAVTPTLMADWEWMVDRLADSTPVAPPGAASTYESLNFGWLVGEIVRRTDPECRDFARFVREELCAPLGVEDLWIGLPESEFGRVAHLVSEMSEEAVANETWVSRAAKPFAVAPVARVHNDPVVWAGSLPGAGGIMTAAAAARIFAMLANGGRLGGVRLLSEDRVRAFAAPRPNPELLDLVLAGGNRVAPPIGMGGYFLEDRNFGQGPGFICHSGAGRSVAFANLDTQLGGAVCHNRMFECDELGADPWALLGPAVRSLAPATTIVAY